MNKQQAGTRPPVILLHGLGRTPRSMRRLARALERAGFAAETWGYPSRHHRLAEHAAELRRRLADWANKRPDKTPVHFVTHSLGALVLRGSLSGAPPVPVGRIVMIAPPNQGAGLAVHFGRSLWARWVFGKPMEDLKQGAGGLAWLGVPDAEIGVIAGERPFHPVNPLSWANIFVSGDLAHDGTVEVANTRLSGMTDFLVVDVHHTFICDDPVVQAQTAAFLRDGRFRHGDEAGVDRQETSRPPPA